MGDNIKSNTTASAINAIGADKFKDALGTYFNDLKKYITLENQNIILRIDALETRQITIEKVLAEHTKILTSGKVAGSRGTKAQVVPPPITPGVVVSTVVAPVDTAEVVVKSTNTVTPPVASPVPDTTKFVANRMHWFRAEYIKDGNDAFRARHTNQAITEAVNKDPEVLAKKPDAQLGAKSMFIWKMIKAQYPELMNAINAEHAVLAAAHSASKAGGNVVQQEKVEANTPPS